MRKVSAADLLELVQAGGQVVRPASEPAPALDLSGLIEAIREIPRAELGELIEAVKGVTIQVDVPAPQVVVREAPRPAVWRFKIDRDQRGRLEEIVATSYSSEVDISET